MGLLFPRLRGLCAFAAVRDRLTGRAFQINPDVTARAIWQSHQETWVRNGLLILLTSTTSSIHAINTTLLLQVYMYSIITSSCHLKYSIIHLSALSSLCGSCDP
jgi:hypothetical protein